MILSNILAFVGLQALSAHASPLAAPTVTLDSATISGVTVGNVNKFLGIPFAQPP